MRRRDDMTLDPEVERELRAIDAALADEPVEAELAELASLVRAVRAERPAPSESFAARLDERAAAGFPRPATRMERTARALRARASRRMLLPALGAAATLLLVLVVTASVLTGGDDAERQSTTELLAPAERPSGRGAAPLPESAARPGAADVAPGAPRRVEREASLTLTAPGDGIDDVTDGVVRVTDEVGGIVANSSVSTGDSGQGGASFSLRVPTRRLDDALARLSKLAHVRARTQNSQDVTGAFVSAQERLRESLAERQALLRQLAEADTVNETESIRARLRIVQGEIAAGRAAVARLRQRTDFAVVGVIVEEGDSDGSGSGGGWTPGDALGDAVRVLEVALGIALVAFAVALPLLLIGLAAALTARVTVRRRRERALEA
jgi:Domain of unknown function (DUF4349)